MTILTSNELCDTLRISRSTLHRLKKSGLPSIGTGRLKRFDLDTTLKWYDEFSDQTHAPQLLPPGEYQCRTCGFQGTSNKAIALTQVAPCPKCNSKEVPLRVA